MVKAYFEKEKKKLIQLDQIVCESPIKKRKKRKKKTRNDCDDLNLLLG